MNKTKIDPALLENVHILENSKQEVIICSKNFDKTKKYLLENKYSFTPYRFAKCFSVLCDKVDISLFSDLEFVNFIHDESKVQTLQNHDIMQLSNLTENKYFGKGQTICFIDTGISPHFDFILPKSRLIKFIDLINHQTDPYDDNGHGTFVTGVACGKGLFNQNLTKIATQANIISIKALSKEGSSNSNKILDAMQWVYENHKVYNITVVCMSFGAESSNKIDPLSNGAEALWDRGITVVVAAGNSGPENNSIKTPGTNPKLITVGAIDSESMTVPDFSSRGPTIYGHKPDLLAPAVNITSCSSKNFPYSKMSGTSVATPVVAGICAILKEKYPNISNNEIKKFLLDNCEKLTGDIDKEGAGFLKFK